ncbi:MAG: hypothetical protein A3F12_03250 [Gammaproteobacteria bacterium RIFCSPHIGHO2_12_FULL_38_14]|nr:MAG: hypothetical protein A3F12_03250 [Gammaproteobacteria bacterium RIFCSPHIGHO2_12_FULL_38_14]
MPKRNYEEIENKTATENSSFDHVVTSSQSDPDFQSILEFLQNENANVEELNQLLHPPNTQPDGSAQPDSFSFDQESQVQLPEAELDTPLADSDDEIIETPHPIPDSFDEMCAFIRSAYQPLLLDQIQPNERAIEKLIKIAEKTCISYLSFLRIFDKDEIRFHFSQDQNEIGVEIKNVSLDRVQAIKKAAKKLIPAIINSNDNDIQFKTTSLDVHNQQSGRTDILWLTFKNLHSQNEFQKIFGRLAFIYQLVKKGIILKRDLAKFIKNLQTKNDDIVLILLNHLESLKDFNKLQLLDVALPEIITKKLNGNYPSRVSPGFERLRTTQEARAKLSPPSSSNEQERLRSLDAYVGYLRSIRLFPSMGHNENEPTVRNPPSPKKI